VVDAIASQLRDRIADAATQYHRLVLLVGSPRSGKTAALNALATEAGWPRINVNLQLAERLLDLTQKQRAARVSALFDEVVKATPSIVVLLDNIEMLFAVELAQDPLRLFQGLSRNRTIVVGWPGRFDGGALTYAEPGHREFKKYPNPQVLIVNAGDFATADVASSQGEHA
jgi:hypothetical protein